VLSARPGPHTAWQQVHAEITRARDCYDILRSWFQEADARKGVTLSLPRIHYILLWLDVNNQWDKADQRRRGRLERIASWSQRISSLCRIGRPSAALTMLSTGAVTSPYGTE